MYVYETSPPTLEEKQGLRAFENRVMKKISRH
jgi:hypothetical protein